MKKLYVEVEETVDGITGNTLDIELEDDNNENFARFEALFDDAVMSQEDYDRLTDIWNEHSTMTGILDALEKTGLIKGYEFVEHKIKNGGSMIVYENVKSGKILSEQQYNKLTEREFNEAVDVEAETLKQYRETDTDFKAYNFYYLNDFGDFDIYTNIEDVNQYNAVLVKYHDNVNQHDKIVIIDEKDTEDLLNLSDDYDDADGDQKDDTLLGIEDILGLN